MNGAKPEIPHKGFEKGAQMSSDDICQKASRLLSEASKREAAQGIGTEKLSPDDEVSYELAPGGEHLCKTYDLKPSSCDQVCV